MQKYIKWGQDRVVTVRKKCVNFPCPLSLCSLESKVPSLICNPLVLLEISWKKIFAGTWLAVTRQLNPPPSPFTHPKPKWFQPATHLPFQKLLKVEFLPGAMNSECTLVFNDKRGKSTPG